jgi:thiamine biosynthesis lipoprotein
MLLALPAGCGPAGSQRQAEFAVFGTRVAVQLRGVDEPTAAAAFRDVGALFQRLHRELHPWEEGALTRLNRALAEGRPHPTTADIVALIDAAARLERASGGHFNAAIGRLVALWGFHTSDYPITDPPPEADAIDALTEKRPSMADVVVDGRRVTSSNPHVQLDFSGIAKGLAVRAACEAIRDRGIASALVNAGGDVLVCGAADRPWRVAIRGPGGAVLETLAVDRPLAVFTSGSSYRYREFDGERYPHILDPETGRPASAAMQATVIDPDALRADAAATALVVAGPDEWPTVAASMGAERAVVVGPDGAVTRYPADGDPSADAPR